mmetsp:Transcript_15495/g.18887  ORF Transcript_15495/g.18887 Transcript_15495/m.18887 type:complete len:156 (-) Transcript_15495:899-1366(-)
MADHPEFFNYAEKAHDQRMWNSHDDWQETTIGGKIVKFLRTMGDNIVTKAIIDAFNDQNGGSSPYARTLSIFANISVLMVGLLFVYAVSRIIQVIIGKEIVVHQEIVIEERVKLSDLLKEDGEQESPMTKNDSDGNKTDGAGLRNRRGKKLRDIQ